MQPESVGTVEFSKTQSIAVVLLASVPTLSVFAMPFMLGGLVDRYHLPSSTMAWAITIELILGSLGALMATLQLERFKPGLMTWIAVVCMALCQFGTIVAPNIATLFVLRGILGLAEGLCVSIASGAIARATQAHRLYSIQGFAVVALTLAVFAGLPALSERHGSSAVFVALALLNFLLIPAPYFVPPRHDGRTRESVRRAFDLRTGTLLLIALLAASASNGAWLYFEQIGVALQLPLNEIVNISLVTTATALVAPWLSLRFQRSTSGTKALSAGLIVQATAVYFYAAGSTKTQFLIGALLLNAGIIFVQVDLLGISARHDATGRTSAAVVGIMSYLGVISGTSASSIAVGENNDFVRFAIFNSALFLIAGLAALFYRQDRTRTNTVDAV